MGLLHLSQSYVPDRFPPDSQEEYMPDPRKKVRKPRTTDPRPGQGKTQRARKPQAKRAAPSSRKTSPLRAGQRAASGFSPKTGDVIKRLRALPSLRGARAMGKQISSGIARPSIVRSSKLSSKTGTRTTDRSFSETGYKAPSARAKKTWAYKKARRAKR